VLASLIPAAFSAAPARISFENSILAVPASVAGAVPRQGRLVRTTLTAQETAASVHFEVALRMRNFAELQARLARGEQVPRAEMAARYFPLPADHDRLVAWLTAQGFIITNTDASRLAVFARGTVDQVQAALQTRFARVATPEGEFTAAVAAPSLPADVGAPVLGIHGLQPHLHAHRMSTVKARRVNPADSAAAPPYYPFQVLGAYGAAGLGLDGTNQTVAIFGFAFPLSTDLTKFWAAANVANTVNNFQTVNVGFGPSNQTTVEEFEEATIDVEWATSIAPKALVRLYGADTSDPSSYDLAFLQVVADQPTQSSLHVFSVSFGQQEDEVDQDYLVIQSQYIATLTAAGVTVFAASGDGGSNPDPTTREYNATAPQTVNSPADDPNVTGVGGTSLSLASSTAVISETAWSGSGGGPSAVFARPPWQAGAGVPAGTQRLTPDVAALGDPNTGGALYIEGTQYEIGGTSLATPIWASLCALLNQARANAKLQPIGQLNVNLYPLNGTAALRDITTGNNGAFSAGPGYDECTGLGVPNMTALLAASFVAQGAAMITVQTANPVAVQGQPATLAVTASGNAPLTYRWQRAPAGSSTFTNLTDNSTYSGSATNVLVVLAPSLGMAGDQFQCVVSNAAGGATSLAQTLTVNAYGVSTLAGWPQTPGAVDGQGWAARFSEPDGIVADSSGNLFVSDYVNSAIRKITPTGAVTTFAGTLGQPASVDGQGTTARFNGPTGLAIDAANNIYVADSGNFTIRKITPAGYVSTVAGRPMIEGATNGPATSAEFEDPEGVAVDASGNLYVSDGGGNTIREVSAAGTVSTLAGSATSGAADGTGTAAGFNYPTGIAVNAAGTLLYVCDTVNSTVRQIAPGGVVSTLAGTAGTFGSKDGSGLTALFYYPTGLKLDASGNLWLTDEVNGTVRMVAPNGTTTTVAGLAGSGLDLDGPLSTAEFYYPADLALISPTLFYVVDVFGSDVRRVAVGTLPQITAAPASVSTTSGQSAQFTVTATGFGTLTYQWQVELAGTNYWTNLTDAGAYSGSATATLSVGNVDTTYDQNQYQCVVTDPAGSTTSAAATLSVAGPPVILTSSPASPQVPAGDAITLSVTASGGTVTYQWAFNSVAISGATTSSYAIGSFGTGNVGTYTVTVTNSYGSTSAIFAASVSLARLVNLSTRAFVGAGAANTLTPGFVISGSGTKSMLIRGDGPALTGFNVPNALPTPALSLYDHNANVIGSNIGWGTTAGGTALLQAAFTQTGAFNFATGSADSAILQSLSAGTSYTAAVSGVNNATGVALAELYDADAGTSTGRLINISTRAQVTAANAIVAGFYIGGSGNEIVLIRGIGPGLAQFNVANVLASPVLTVFDANQNVIATTQNWNPALAATFAQVYAFNLQSGSNDTAVLLTLPAGSGYTAQVSGLNSTSGDALVEIYEVP
jgi:sugar lactone lactonase YvrE